LQLPLASPLQESTVLGTVQRSSLAETYTFLLRNGELPCLRWSAPLRRQDGQFPAGFRWALPNPRQARCGGSADSRGASQCSGAESRRQGGSARPRQISARVRFDRTPDKDALPLKLRDAGRDRNVSIPRIRSPRANDSQDLATDLRSHSAPKESPAIGGCRIDGPWCGDFVLWSPDAS
jgi:hypothetical protein